jgi:hypothetical protein
MAAPLGVIPAWLMLVWLPPAQAAAVPQSQTVAVTLSISPNPTVVGRRTVFTARVTPAPKVALAFRFFVDGAPVCADRQDSPECLYIPSAAGRHFVHVEVGVRPSLAAREAQRSTSKLTSRREPFDVRPAPPDKPPILLSLKLISSPVRVGDAAVFEVTAANALALPPLVFDPGDGSPRTTVDRTQFRHVYQKAGQVIASVSLPPNIVGKGSSVLVDVSPPAKPPILLSLKLISSPVRVGDAAVFEVTAANALALPPVVFDPGDGSARTTVDTTQFRHVYQRAGPVVASVSLQPGIIGRGDSVRVDVESAPPPPTPPVPTPPVPTPPAPTPPLPTPPEPTPPLPPIALVLQLVTPEVAPGAPARFAVSVAGGRTLPQYVLDVGDGSAPQNRGDAAFTHVYQRAGQYLASVSLPAGVVGTGSTVNVVVRAADGLNPWVYVGLVLLAIVGAYAAGRAARRPRHPRVVVTLHPRPHLHPAFRPAKPRGVSLDVRFVRNLRRIRFTPRVLTGRKD